MSIFHLTISESADGQDAYDVYSEVNKEKKGPQSTHFDISDKFKARINQLHQRVPHLRFQDYLEQEDACRLIGEDLFESFLCGDVLRQYEEYRADADRLRIALYLPRKLYWLPWEVLRDPTRPEGEFLSVQGSLVRCDSELTNKGAAIFRPLDKVNILFFFASPGAEPLGAIHLPKELTKVTVDEVERTTYEEFRRQVKNNMQSCGFILYGHGDVDDDSYGRFVFVREAAGIDEKDPRRATSMAQYVTSKSLRTALLVACESGWVKAESPFRKTLVGALFLRTSLDFVIAMQQKIDFYAALDFLRRTVASLEDEVVDLDVAVANGRQAIRDITPERDKKQLSNLDWWIPVMYSRTTLFQLLSRPSELPRTIAVTPEEELREERTCSPGLREYISGLRQLLGSVFRPEENRQIQDILK